jgi:hypothetical protein
VRWRELYRWTSRATNLSIKNRQARSTTAPEQFRYLVSQLSTQLLQIAQTNNTWKWYRAYHVPRCLELINHCNIGDRQILRERMFFPSRFDHEWARHILVILTTPLSDVLAIELQNAPLLAVLRALLPGKALLSVGKRDIYKSARLQQQIPDSVNLSWSGP